MSRYLNVDLIEDRIRDINDSLFALSPIIESDFHDLGTTEHMALRYLIIQLVEAAATICTNMMIVFFNEKPAGFPSCFSRLAQKGMLSTSLGNKFASASRLRNILVHRYWVIDDEKIYELLKSGRQDFLDFIKEIRKILDKEAKRDE